MQNIKWLDMSYDGLKIPFARRLGTKNSESLFRFYLTHISTEFAEQLRSSHSFSLVILLNCEIFNSVLSLKVFLVQIPSAVELSNPE